MQHMIRQPPPLKKHSELTMQLQVTAETNTFCCAIRVERSTDQVIKPVNVEALSKWVGKIPADVVRDMAVIAPMLSRLGYDPHANPPNYGRPDPKVLDNTRRVSTAQNSLLTTLS